MVGASMFACFISRGARSTSSEAIAAKKSSSLSISARRSSTSVPSKSACSMSVTALEDDVSGDRGRSSIAAQFRVAIDVLHAVDRGGGRVQRAGPAIAQVHADRCAGGQVDGLQSAVHALGQSQAALLLVDQLD